jgi:hypothetical protein
MAQCLLASPETDYNPGPDFVKSRCGSALSEWGYPATYLLLVAYFFPDGREFFEQSDGKFVEIAKKRRDYNSYCLVTL